MWGWIWTAWLAALAGSFAVLEGVALARKGETLSQFVWWLSLKWGPLPYVLGALAGGLAVHFWWHWTPSSGG